MSAGESATHDFGKERCVHLSSSVTRKYQFFCIRNEFYFKVQPRSKKRLWHRSMVSQQLSMPTSLTGSRRGSVTSLTSLNVDLATVDSIGRSLSLVDVKRDTISLCSFSETDELHDGVSRKTIALTQLFEF